MTRRVTALENQVAEWNYVSGQDREDPFNELELDVSIQHAGGDSWRVPAYWAGGQEWRVRFTPPKPGAYEATTVCSDKADLDLHGVTATVEVSGNESSNPR